MTYDPQDLSAARSGLYLVGQILTVVRERFRPDQNLPWSYTGHPQNDSIVIVAQGDPESETASATPRIVVRRGTTGYQQLALGDADHRILRARFTPGTEVMTFGVSTTISCDVITQQLGAGEIIADLVGALFMGGRHLLTRSLNINTLGPLVIQPGQRIEEDAPKWLVSVQFPLTYETSFVADPFVERALRANISADDEPIAVAETAPG